jgi:hypothetical protein
MIDELARVFGDGVRAIALLRSAGMPAGRIPSVHLNAVTFWELACEQLENGSHENGFRGLAKAAARLEPGNQLFREMAGGMTRASASSAAPAASSAPPPHTSATTAIAPPSMKRATRAAPIEVFISYSHRDHAFLERLLVHLALLNRQGLITTWTDREITAGDRWRGQIHERLNSAGVVLALVSADFLASEYCHDIEMRRALERDAAGEARVIPIVVNPCAWRDSPLGELQALPPSGLAISLWPSTEDAFDKTRAGIQRAIEVMTRTTRRN